MDLSSLGGYSLYVRDTVYTSFFWDGFIYTLFVDSKVLLPFGAKVQVIFFGGLRVCTYGCIASKWNADSKWKGWKGNEAIRQYKTCIFWSKIKQGSFGGNFWCFQVAKAMSSSTRLSQTTPMGNATEPTGSPWPTSRWAKLMSVSLRWVAAYIHVTGKQIQERRTRKPIMNRENSVY